MRGWLSASLAIADEYDISHGVPGGSHRKGDGAGHPDGDRDTALARRSFRRKQHAGPADHVSWSSSGGGQLRFAGHIPFGRLCGLWPAGIKLLGHAQRRFGFVAAAERA